MRQTGGLLEVEVDVGKRLRDSVQEATSGTLHVPGVASRIWSRSSAGSCLQIASLPWGKGGSKGVRAMKEGGQARTTMTMVAGGGWPVCGKPTTDSLLTNDLSLFGSLQNAFLGWQGAV